MVTSNLPSQLSGSMIGDAHANTGEIFVGNAGLVMTHRVRDSHTRSKNMR